jgi:hypothetical protein
MSYIVVDVEADGPVPGLFSMICFGAVVVEPSLSKTFYGTTSPITSAYNPEALAVSGFSRKEHENFTDPLVTMQAFDRWIKTVSIGHPIFISDNPAFDWQWINYYFHWLLGKNPFGYSGRRLGDLYCGMVKDTRAAWKHLRKTPHTHNPVDDAMGDAEVLLQMQEMGLKIKLL